MGRHYGCPSLVFKDAQLPFTCLPSRSCFSRYIPPFPEGTARQVPRCDTLRSPDQLHLRLSHRGPSGERDGRCREWLVPTYLARHHLPCSHGQCQLARRRQRSRGRCPFSGGRSSLHWVLVPSGPDAGLMPGGVGASWNGKDKTVPQGRRGRKTGRGPGHFRALALRASQGDVRLAVSHPSLNQEELRLWDRDPHSQ